MYQITQYVEAEGKGAHESHELVTNQTASEYLNLFMTVSVSHISNCQVIAHPISYEVPRKVVSRVCFCAHFQTHLRLESPD